MFVTSPFGRFFGWTSFLGLLLLSGSSTHAAIIALLNNPSFENVAIADNAIDPVVHGWIEGDFTGNAAGANANIPNPPDSQLAVVPTALLQFPTPTHGNQYAALVLRNNEGSTQSYIFQSIGTVTAGDIGRIIRVEADFGSRHQGAGKQASGGISLRSGITQTAFGSNVVAQAGQNFSTGSGVFPDGAPFGTLYVEWEITNMHLGVEIFIVASVASESANKKSVSDQYYVDNVRILDLTEVEVPEPASFVLLATGMAFVVLLSRRRRSKQ